MGLKFIFTEDDRRRALATLPDEQCGYPAVIREKAEAAPVSRIKYEPVTMTAPDGAVTHGVGWYVVDDDCFRLRAAMAGMSNVMAGLVRVFEQRGDDLDWYRYEQQESPVIDSRGDDRARLSREWSAEVRRRLKEREEQARVRVYCQTEED